MIFLKHHAACIVFFGVLLFFVNCSGSFSDDPHLNVQDDNSLAGAQTPTLNIYVIDVGQGNATLILGPETSGHQTSLLIDAGGLDPDGGAAVLQLFDSLGLESLDAILLTHYDADHMGGFVTTYESTSILWDENCEPTMFFPTRTIIDLEDSEKDTDSVLEYTRCRDANLSLLSEEHIVVGATASENVGYEFNLGADYIATVVAGNGYVIGQSDQVADVDTQNEKSIAVLVSGPNDFYFLVTGDLTGQVFGSEDALVESALANTLVNSGVDLSVLQVGHHGSATSSAPEFLQTLQPEAALISVGDNNYGHPNCNTLENLLSESILVIQTESANLSDCTPDEQEASAVANGNIEISVAGENYIITTPDEEYVCSVETGCVE